jgi:hypothetical protein
MKKTSVLLGVLLLLIVVLTIGGSKKYWDKSNISGEVMILDGYIVDNLCANEYNGDNLNDCLNGKTKDSVLLPSNRASGFSIYANSQLYPVSKESYKMITDFLERPETSLRVLVRAKKEGDFLRLLSIENQP